MDGDGGSGHAQAAAGGVAVAAVTVLLAAVRPCGTGTALIDQLRELADLKSAAAALQARITVAFDGLERGAQAGAGLPAAELGTGVDPTRQPRRHRTACQSPPGPGHHDVPDCPAPGRLRRRCARRPSLGTPTPCARTGIRGPARTDHGRRPGLTDHRRRDHRHRNPARHDRPHPLPGRFRFGLPPRLRRDGRRPGEEHHQGFRFRRG